MWYLIWKYNPILNYCFSIAATAKYLFHNRLVLSLIPIDNNYIFETGIKALYKFQFEHNAPHSRRFSIDRYSTGSTPQAQSKAIPT